MKKKLTAIAIVACLIVVSLSTFMFSQSQSADTRTSSTLSERSQPDKLTQPSDSPNTEISDNPCNDPANEDMQTPGNDCDDFSSEAAQDTAPGTDIPPPDGRIFLTAGPPYPYLPTAIPIKIKDPILPFDPID